MSKQILVDLRQPKIELEVTEDCEILGILVGNGKEEVNCELIVRHRRPQLQSLVLVKAVLTGKSKFDFEGKLVIERGAKQTDTYLKASVLMLSPTAKAVATPSLEIMETDVKGGHGATVGQVDQDQLFYLQSRGLDYETATQTLVDGFLADVAARFTSAEAKQKLNLELQKLK
jgi:Fe-S cluster assembly protein SufD